MIVTERFFCLRLGICALAGWLPLGATNGRAHASAYHALATPTQVTFIGAAYPAISPNGDVLCAVRFGTLILFNLGGAPLDTLAAGAHPSWSPDGEKVAFRAAGMRVAHIATGQVDDLCPGTCNVNNGLSWSPLGDEIAYQDPDDGIGIVTYPGGSVSILSCADPAPFGCEGEGPTWSPDAEWIAFEDGLEILKVRRTGGIADTVVAGVGDVTTPAWSPDGKWIALTIEEYDPGTMSSYYHIWVADSRGMAFGLHQITSGEVRDSSPAWAPDSKEIYFDSDRSGEIEVWRVEFDASVPVRTTTWGRIKAERR